MRMLCLQIYDTYHALRASTDARIQLRQKRRPGLPLPRRRATAVTASAWVTASIACGARTFNITLSNRLPRDRWPSAGDRRGNKVVPEKGVPG